MYILYTTTPVSCLHTLLCNMTVQLCQWTNSKIGQLADRWQQSFQQQYLGSYYLPLIFVPGSTNTRPEQPSFETTVIYFKSGGYIRVGWQRRHITVRVGWQRRHITVVVWNIYAIILIVHWWSYCENFSKENEVNSQCRNERNNFFAQIRRNAVFRHDFRAWRFFKSVTMATQAGS